MAPNQKDRPNQQAGSGSNNPSMGRKDQRADDFNSGSAEDEQDVLKKKFQHERDNEAGGLGDRQPGNTADDENELDEDESDTDELDVDGNVAELEESEDDAEMEGDEEGEEDEDELPDTGEEEDADELDETGEEDEEDDSDDDDTTRSR